MLRFPDAIQSVDVVVRCASDPRRPESDVAGITNLIQALRKTGQDAHLVYISIVGVDALPWSCYRAKRDVEGPSRRRVAREPGLGPDGEVRAG